MSAEGVPNKPSKWPPPWWSSSSTVATLESTHITSPPLHSTPLHSIPHPSAFFLGPFSFPGKKVNAFCKIVEGNATQQQLPLLQHGSGVLIEDSHSDEGGLKWIEGGYKLQSCIALARLFEIQNASLISALAAATRRNAMVSAATAAHLKLLPHFCGMNKLIT